MSSASGENVINILVIKQSDGDDMHDELPDLTDFLCPAQPQQFHVSPSLSSQYYDPADQYDISRPPQSQESSTSARPALTKSHSFTIVDSPQRLPCHNNTWWSSAGQQPLTLKEQPFDLLVGDQVDGSGGGNKGNKCGGKLVKHKSINIPPVKESRAQVCPSPTHSFNLSHDSAPSHNFTPTQYSSSTPHPRESQWRRRIQTVVTSGTPDSGFCTPSSDIMFSPPSLSSYREADSSCLPTVSLNKDSEIFSPSTPTLNKNIRVSDGGETSQSCDKAENEDNEEELETSLESVQWLQDYSLEQAFPPLYTSVGSQCNHPGNPSSLTSQVNSVTCSTGSQEMRDAAHNPTPDLLKPLPVIMAPLLGETHRTPALDTQPSHRPALAEIQINTLQAGPSTQSKKDVLERPRYSYTDLIKMALQYSTEGQLTLREIVGWIQEQFPYFKHRAKPGWRNSIRHNLSLHPDFVKEGEKKHGGKWKLAENGHKPFPKVVKSAVRRPPAQPKVSTPVGKKCFRTGVQPILPKSFPYALVPLAALCTHPNLGQQQLLQQQQESPAPFTYINGQLQQLLHQQQHHPPVHTVRHQPPLLPKPQTCASNDQPKVTGSSAIVTVWPYHGQTSQVPSDGHCSEVTVQNSSHEVNAGGAGGVMTGQHVSRMFGDHGQVRPAVWSPQQGETDHRICKVTEGTSAVAGWLVSWPDTGHSSAAVTKPAERQTSGQPRSRPICKLVDKIYRSKSFDVESRSTPDRGPHNPGRLGKKVGPSRRRASVVNTASVLTEDMRAAQTIDQLLDQDNGWGLSWDVNCGSSVETVDSCPSSGQTVDSHPNSGQTADSNSICLLTADSDPNCGSMLSLIEQAWQEAQTKTAEHGCPTEWESQEDTLYTSHPACSEGDTSHTLHTPPPPSSECLTPSVTQAFTVFSETPSSLQWTDMASQPHLDRQCDTDWQSGRTKSRRKQVHIPLTTEVSPGRDKDGVVS